MGKRHEVEKRCDRYESDREIEIQYRINQNLVTFERGCVSCGCQLIPLRGNAHRITIAPQQQHINDTVKLVFGQERSLFPYPKTRDNTGTSKEINLSATKHRPKTNPDHEVNEDEYIRLYMNNGSS